MHHLSIDLETYSSVPLAKAGENVEVVVTMG